MAQNLDEIANKLRDGELVPTGAPRDVYIAGFPPETGDILAGPYVIVSLERDGDQWRAKIVRLASPDAEPD